MTKAQEIADIMMQDMFASHELPVDDELAGKYLNLANKILAALPQSSQEPVSADELAAFIADEFSHLSSIDARTIARVITDKYSVTRPLRNPE